MPYRSEDSFLFAPADKQSDVYELQVIMLETKHHFKVVVLLQSLSIGQTVYFKIFETDTKESLAQANKEIKARVIKLREHYEYNEIPSNQLEPALYKLLQDI